MTSEKLIHFNDPIISFSIILLAATRALHQ